ncbi:zinc-dependent metalloprotease [Halosquirtibacter xylanolyticus]|uniref:zinc-dependent metalloprotease n=1 Tax=Halosquirtibacter xylanolyticus TaxID=3374599 RepID=UPI003749B9FC|nr:zinc-dependent metalloprotease [Prolixibacteraceae bacterium]
MKVFTLTMVFTMLFSFLGFTQKQNQHKCSNSEQYQSYMKDLKQNPQLAKEVENSLERSKRHKKHSFATDQNYIIPIVFHIIHDHGVENITDEKVHEALDIINEDYASINSDLNQLEPSFKSRIGVPNIEFRLAKVDPSGNYTTGITRDVSPLTINGSWDHPEVKRINSWPHDKYLNIWIVRSSNGSNGSAWAYLPYQVDNDDYADLDGIIISSWAFGATTQGYHRILTHEIGHFLNLYHTWSPWLECGAKDACGEDDEVTDTPNCTGYYGGCDTSHSSCGSLDMIQNYMDYAQCPVAFTKGQVERMHTALNSNVAKRNNLWSAENLKATLYPETALIDIQGKKLIESRTNDGTFENVITGKIVDYEFLQESWDPTKVSFDNVPLGLTPEIEIVDNTHFELRFRGKANLHEAAQNISLKVNIDGSLLSTGSSKPTSFGVPVQFRNKYEIVYENTNYHVDSQNTWKYFTIKNTSFAYGFWYDAGKLRLETYKKSILCEDNSENISPIEYGQPINKSGNWNPGGDYPKEHDFTSPNYKKWSNKTAYLGFQVINEMNEPIYGWMKVSVNSSSDAMDLIEYALNTNPNEGILAGQEQQQIAAFSVTRKVFEEEKDTNDGSLLQHSLLSFLNHYQLDSDRDLRANIDYTITGLPVGLTPTFRLIDGKIDLAFSSRAKTHGLSNSSSFTIQLKDHLFTSTQKYRNEIKFDITFIDPYKIITGELPSVSVDSSNKWKWFALFDEGPTYGNWYFEDGHIKLETYNKECITHIGTRNIMKLRKGSIISSDQNWKAPEAYPNQLDIYHAGYTDWYHTEGYIGIVFNVNGTTHYGWLKGKMTGPGTHFEITQYGYNEKPNAPILAGESEAPVIYDIDITSSIQTIEVDEKVQYQLHTTESIEKCTWTFDGGYPNQYIGNTPPPVTYKNNGTFHVQIEVLIDGQTITFTKENIVTVVKPTAITAELLSDRKVIYKEESIQFSIKGSHEIEDCQWTFEGGSPNSYQGIIPPKVIYNQEGVYNVSAIVTLNGHQMNILKDSFITVKEPVVSNYCIPEVNPTYLGLKITEVGINYRPVTVHQEGYINSNHILSFNQSGYNVVSAKVTPEWEETYVRVWIDWNGNNDFEESERVAEMVGPSSQYGTAVYVPEGAVTDTKMRFMLYYGDMQKSACDPITYQGMVIDYPVRILKTKVSTENSIIPKSEIKIYPNPVSDILHLQLEYRSNIDIINVLGNKIKTINLSPGPHQIMVTDLKPGVYILNITSKESNYQKRIMVK